MSRKQKGTATTQTSEVTQPIPAVSEHMDTLQRAMVQSSICQGQNLEQKDSASAMVEPDPPAEHEELIIMALHTSNLRRVGRSASRPQLQKTRQHRLQR